MIAYYAGPVLVRGKLRCPNCGDSEAHGCSGPNREWQNELIEEIRRLRVLLIDAGVDPDLVKEKEGGAK